MPAAVPGGAEEKQHRPDRHHCGDGLLRMGDPLRPPPMTPKRDARRPVLFSELREGQARRAPRTRGAAAEWNNMMSSRCSVWAPGRPEELHLQSPTDPYVSLSTRTARASLSRVASPLHSDAESSSLLPVAWLASPLLGLAPPLRSLLITRSSPLLRENPPPPGASILSPFMDSTYRVFSLHHPASSHVP